MIGKVYVYALIGICIILVVKNSGSKMSFPISAVCSISILIMTIPFWEKIVSLIRYSESEISRLDNILYIPLVLIASEYLCSICNDIGEKTLAEAITVFTKTAVVASGVKLLSNLLDIIKGFT